MQNQPKLVNVSLASGTSPRRQSSMSVSSPPFQPASISSKGVSPMQNSPGHVQEVPKKKVLSITSPPSTSVPQPGSSVAPAPASVSVVATASTTPTNSSMPLASQNPRQHISPPASTQPTLPSVSASPSVSLPAVGVSIDQEFQPKPRVPKVRPTRKQEEERERPSPRKYRVAGEIIGALQSMNRSLEDYMRATSRNARTQRPSNSEPNLSATADLGQAGLSSGSAKVLSSVAALELHSGMNTPSAGATLPTSACDISLSQGSSFSIADPVSSDPDVGSTMALITTTSPVGNAEFGAMNAATIVAVAMGVGVASGLTAVEAYRTSSTAIIPGNYSNPFGDVEAFRLSTIATARGHQTLDVLRMLGLLCTSTAGVVHGQHESTRVSAVYEPDDSAAGRDDQLRSAPLMESEIRLTSDGVYEVMGSERAPNQSHMPHHDAVGSFVRMLPAPPLSSEQASNSSHRGKFETILSPMRRLTDRIRSLSSENEVDCFTRECSAVASSLAKYLKESAHVSALAVARMCDPGHED